jgi:hypothetical protein
MNWTPQKTRIILLVLAFAAVVGIAVAFKMEAFPVGPDVQRWAVRLLTVVGVLLLLQYVREVSSKPSKK